MKFGLPPLKSGPEFHDIGDRVIILESLKVGFITGLDDYMVYVLEAQTRTVRKVHFNQVFNEKW